MKRTTISLPDGLAAVLNREAGRRGVSVSQVVREAIEERLGPSAGAGRKLRFAALGRSGHRSTARDLEDNLETEWAIERPPDTVVERTADAFNVTGRP